MTATKTHRAIAGVVPARAGRREWIGLAVIALPCVLYSLDLTVLNLAVPALSAELRPTASQLLWIIDIYGFLVAGSLITMGTLGDRIGRRRLLLIGAAAFGAASVLAACAKTTGMLIAARALLGIAGATLAPSTLSLIRNMFLDARQRTVAISVWLISYSVGGAIGPLLGGLVLERFAWGAVFLLAVPVMALLLLLGPRLLPEFRDPGAGRLDLASAALSLAAVLSVIYGLKQIAENGPGWLPAASILSGVGAGVVFARRQARLADPLIDLALFRAPGFGVSLVTYMVSCFVAFGIYIFISQYLQIVLGLTPLRAGLWTLPWSLGFIVGSMLAPAIARSFRIATVVVAGLAISALGFGLLALVGRAPALVLIVAGSVVFSLGLAPVITLANDMIISAAPPERAGAAAGISETTAELGGALGIAILGSVGTAVYRTRISDTAPGGVPSAAMRAARGTLGGAFAVAEKLPDPTGAALRGAAGAAFTEAFRLAAVICAAVVIATAVAAAILLRRGWRAGTKPAGAPIGGAPCSR